MHCTLDVGRRKITPVNIGHTLPVASLQDLKINNNKAPASPFISADNIVNLKINIKKDVFAQNKSTMKSFMTNQEKAQQLF